MTATEEKRLRRIIAALDGAIDLFVRSEGKPRVGDIDAENELRLLREEVNELLLADYGSISDQLDTAAASGIRWQAASRRPSP